MPTPLDLHDPAQLALLHQLGGAFTEITAHLALGNTVEALRQLDDLAAGVRAQIGGGGEPAIVTGGFEGDLVDVRCRDCATAYRVGLVLGATPGRCPSCGSLSWWRPDVVVRIEPSAGTGDEAAGEGTS